MQSLRGTVTPERVARVTTRQIITTPGTNIQPMKLSRQELDAHDQLRGLLKQSGVTLSGFDLFDRKDREGAIALIAHVAALNEGNLTDAQVTTRFGLNTDPVSKHRISDFVSLRALYINSLRVAIATLGPDKSRQLLATAQKGAM